MTANKQYSLTTVDPEDAVLPDNKVGAAVLSAVVTVGLTKAQFGLNSLKKELRKFADQSFQDEELREAAKFASRRPKELRTWLNVFEQQQIIEEVS